MFVFVLRLFVLFICQFKWMSVRLRTKWLWVRIPLQSLILIFIIITYFRPMFQTYKNQSIDLQYNSINWFLCEWNNGLKWVQTNEKKKTIFTKKQKMIPKLVRDCLQISLLILGELSQINCFLFQLKWRFWGIWENQLDWTHPGTVKRVKRS